MATTRQGPPLHETPDLHGAFPRLGDDHLAALERRGSRRRTSVDEVLIRAGDEDYDFFVILEGLVATLDESGEEARPIGVHGRCRFLGELSMLTGEASFLTAVVREPGEVLQVPVDAVREIVGDDASLGDLILRALMQRRWLLIQLGTGLRIIGSRYSPDTRRLREFAARNRLPHTWIDLDDDPQAEAVLSRLGVAPQETPVVVWGEDHLLRNPGNAELARAVGLAHAAPETTDFELVVVGAGPAGLAASVYGPSDGLATMTVDGVATGGQAGTSPRIENYLGFPSGISGGELADRAVIQARKFGASITVPSEATALRPGDDHHVVVLEDGTEVSARTVIIATGVRYRRLPVPGIEDLEGTSVFHAATLVEARVCSGDPVAVVGGGNSAGQASLFLADYAVRVRLVVRAGDLSANMSRYLVDRVERHPNIDVLLHSEVRELVLDHGDLRGLVVEDNRTGERRTVDAWMLFIFIGAEPHSGWLGDVLALDRDGFVLTGEDAAGHHVDDGHRPMPLETSTPGIFAVGDVRHGSIKRMSSAVGEGAMAVRLVHQHLQDLHGAPQPGQR